MNEIFEFAAKLGGTVRVGEYVSCRGTAKRLLADRQRFENRVTRAARDRDTERDGERAWLLDNRYLVSMTAEGALAELKGAGRLPADGEEPAVLTAAKALLHVTGYLPGKEELSAFLRGYRRSRPLQQRELALFLTMLKCAIIGRLTEEAEESVLAACFTTLRVLHGGELRQVVRENDDVEEILSADPTGDYPRMDEESRALYRRELEKAARKSGLLDAEAALLAVELAKSAGKHVGHFILRDPLGRGERREASALYASLRAALSLGFAGAVGRKRKKLIPLLLLPASEAAETVADMAFSRFGGSCALPALDVEKGVPEKMKTLCVISCILTGKERVLPLVRRLEELACGTEGDNLLLGLLADLPESDRPLGGEDIADFAAGELRRAAERRNREMFLFTRPRVLSEKDGVYRGKDRKRGAIGALIALLGGSPTQLAVKTGDAHALHGTKYVILLDEDTEPYPGSLGLLIGTIAHPLNRAVVVGGTVTSGYGVIEPGVSPLLGSLGQPFAEAMGGQGGYDRYAENAKDARMAATGTVTFGGKGIVDVGAYLKCVSGRLPEGKVLSHDILEGELLRTGRQPRARFFDAFPQSAAAFFRRSDRWIRGDWQNIRFLRGELGAVSKLRIADNLRRSLVSTGTLAAVLLGAPAALLFHSSGELAAFLASPAERYRSGRLTRKGAATLGALMKSALLPLDAAISVRAALTALWRTSVTGKNLLQWSTAAESEREGERALLEAFPGMAAALLSRRAPYLAPLWLLGPLLAGVKRREEPELCGRERDFIHRQARLMWGYFRDNMTPENRWLVPDNVQIRPRKGPALRISPTNIGLSLLAVLTAMDLGLEERERGLAMIEGCLTSVEALPKDRGHLYNWYDIRTMEPLTPAVLSSVDSGNLMGCLIALIEALDSTEGGERAAKLARGLLENMDLSLLYNREKELFAVGTDREGELTRGSYDLLMSEARQTSFIAAALNQVPLRHWQALARPLAAYRGAQGMASWTGTMFEYLMPRLLLPEPVGSALDESALFCLAAQRRGELWGTSESGYYSFDETLDYRYKANGVGALGLRRGLDGDRVIAPYASFLALSVDPRGAVRNLMRLKDRGLEGKYGLYEALDLTPGREGAVMSYMAHHLGMSLAAADNALRGGIMVKRFMRSPQMSRCRLLLEERIPHAARPVRTAVPEGPEEVRRAPEGESRLAGTGEGMFERAVLSNGLMSAFVSRAGSVTLRCAGYELLREGSLLFWLEEGEKRQYLTPAPAFAGKYESVFTGGEARFLLRGERFSATLTLNVLREEPALRARVTVNGEFGGNVCCSFVPCLDRRESFEAHPVFSELFVSMEEAESCVLAEGRGRNAPTLGAAASGGEVRVTLRDRKRGEAAPPVFTVSADEECVFTFTAGEDRKDALQRAREALVLSRISDRAADFLLLSGGFSPASARKTAGTVLSPAGRGALCPASRLYPLGISGDIPILSCGAQEERMEEMILDHRFLAWCALPYDLVLFVPEEGYDRPVYQKLLRTLRRLDSEGELSKRGGIHIVGTEYREMILSLEAIPSKIPLKREKTARKPGFEYENDGGEVRLRGLPEKVWSVPLASKTFGAIAADCGLMGSWYRNARENRFTPWDNDPLAMEGSETLRIKDESGEYSAFSDGDGRTCTVTMRPGAITWEKGNASCTAFVPFDRSCRLLLVTLQGEAEASLTVPVIMGASNGEGRFAHVEECENGAVAENGINASFPRERGYVLAKGASCRIEGNRVTLTVRGEGKHVFLTGFENAPSLLLPERAEEELKATLERWRSLTGRVQIKTGDRNIDNYVNRWTLYQLIASRLWGRCSVYQCGGAYGMRDQLQDVCALIFTEPRMAREHILKAASMQFSEGDCAHWWHELGTGAKGVRTRCSDDLLWLPYAACLYVRMTGDRSLLSERVSYLTAPPLGENERDRYAPLIAGTDSGTVLDHMIRAADRAIARGKGRHGLPLVGSGDWNDGMDKVGEKGAGESVWLGWFMAGVLRELDALAPGRGYRKEAESLTAAGEAAWDGRWYRRGYFDSGEPLGSAQSPACRVDAIAQGFAPFGGADSERARTALLAAKERLTDREYGLIKLFEGPFHYGEKPDPGYIAAYPEGVRENGGQYTHGALWLAMGMFEAGLNEQAEELMKLLAPGAQDMDRYLAEPFVLAADVGMRTGREGEAGWTWYTGSAGWFYTIVMRYMAGIDMRNGELSQRTDKKTPVTLDGRPINHLQAEEKNV